MSAPPAHTLNPRFPLTWASNSADDIVLVARVGVAREVLIGAAIED